MKKVKEMTLDIGVSVKQPIADIVQESIKVQQAWERFGGSFTKGLSQALLHADINNVIKIRNAWPEYWQNGLDMYNSRLANTGDETTTSQE